MAYVDDADRRTVEVPVDRLGKSGDELMLATPPRGRMTGGLAASANAIVRKDYVALSCASARSSA